MTEVKPDNIVPDMASEDKPLILKSDYTDIDNSFNLRIAIINRCMCDANRNMINTLIKETVGLHRKAVILNDNIKLLEIIKTNKAQSEDVAKKLQVINKQIIEEYIKTH